MRIHGDLSIPLGQVIICEHGVVAIVGPIAALCFDDDGTDEDLDIYLHPEEAEWFIATFFPNYMFAKRRLH